ncbi:MAG: RDD family protein [Deltaproteobacteria bacterium]|nr:RDD family protein [Deltaproteobacteria bacterium]MBW2129170.1 RDD family protein [Deltaproteobacteria bacterium]MBW2304179.1 RDD family protein [Deltaproteobacteria bacterium]
MEETGNARPETVPPKPPEVPSSNETLAKADPVKRIIALVIDGVAAAIVGFIPFVGGIIGALYMLFRDALPIEALEYKSVGKKLMKLSVVKTEGPPARIDYGTSAKRNWMFALGPIMMFLLLIPVIGWILDILIAIGWFVLVIIELVKIFSDKQGIRLGDKMAGTMVVED